MGLQFFPIDLGIPALVEVTGTETGRILAPHLPECRDGARVVRARAELHRHRPGRRCLLRVTLRLVGPAGESSTRVVFAKLFADDRGARAFTHLKALWDVSRRSSCLRLAEPLGYDADRRMLLMEEVHGDRALNDWIRCLEEEQPLPAGVEMARLEAAMAVVAEALAELQGSAIDPGESRRFEDDCGQAVAQTRALEGAHPKLAREARALLESLTATEPSGVRLVPAHGGFRHKQLLGNDRSLTIIDWDGFTLAPPALDAASFACRLRHFPITRPGRFQELERLAGVFRRELAARVPAFDVREMARYEALILVETAQRALRHPRQSHRIEAEARALLTEARRLTAEVAAGGARTDTGS
jgi:aminoglycoside phosphotransferase (APT) family kinase protein